MKRSIVYMGGFLAIVGALGMSQTAFAGGAALHAVQSSLGAVEVVQGEEQVLLNNTYVRVNTATELKRVTFSCVGEGSFSTYKLYQGGHYIGSSVPNIWGPFGLRSVMFDVEYSLEFGDWLNFQVYGDVADDSELGELECAITELYGTLTNYPDYQAGVHGNMEIHDQNTTILIEAAVVEEEEEDVCEDSKNMGGSQIICVGETYTYAGLNIISTNLYANKHFAVFQTNAWTGYDSDYFVVKVGERFVLTAKNGEAINVYYRGMDYNGQPHFFINKH